MLVGFKLKKYMLDSRGNIYKGWSIGEKRGNFPYYPPLGWIGFGLKVWDRFDNNKWLGNNNAKGEWAVAYHGVGRNQSSDDVKKITNKICLSFVFKPGSFQYHQNCLDENHPGRKVGNGVYFNPDIQLAEAYAGISEINNNKYKTVLMVRINPYAIRSCNCNGGSNYIVNGTVDEVRPYRILLKRID